MVLDYMLGNNKSHKKVSQFAAQTQHFQSLNKPLLAAKSMAAFTQGDEHHKISGNKNLYR